MIRNWRQRRRELSQWKGIPIEETRFVICDIETTGLNISRDRILSIGLVALEGLRLSPEKVWSTHIIDHEYQGGGSFIHQITSEDLQGGASLAQALERTREFIDGSAFVAHHAMLDHGILQREFKKNGILPLPGIFIDTIRLAQRLDGQAGASMPQNSYSLEALADRFDIPHPSVHDALTDAWVTGGLLIHLLRGLKQRGIRTTDQLFV